ncbi:MAG: hypothetical protein QTN59_07620 [Candidatus Electrothrix communis]|nr:MAG: hypothetical protein QTN59_07620 [Candidatus Electrothrix communis]
MNDFSFIGQYSVLILAAGADRTIGDVYQSALLDKVVDVFR